MSIKSVTSLAVVVLLCAVVPVLGQSELPDGHGKEMVQNLCSQCHGLNRVTEDGYTRGEWEILLTSMVDLPQDQVDVVADYLAANFPEQPKPPAVIVPGDVSVSIREWLVPTRGSRPHDPLSSRYGAGPDGSIWWTGQWADKLGRLNPSTGAMTEYPLPEDSGPHGLAEDVRGNIWFTGISTNYIGMLDPETGEVDQYPLTEGRGPHTPIFDQSGTLWFTLQSGMVGRLVPSTGEMKVSATPTSNTYPYGIVVSSHGVPWYVDFRGNRIGRVDPETMEITEFTLPNPDARPRRIAITSDDVIWYTDYARGYLGRFDPETGAVQEWASPGGRESQPYGIAVVDDVVWYSESAVKPNTLVRFAPETERFQTWEIPSGGGVVRNMMATHDGNLVMACSGFARVALVEVGN